MASPTVGVEVRVEVEVAVEVSVGVGVLVEVEVEVEVDVSVGVEVGVPVKVEVPVGVEVGVSVKVEVEVPVGVEVGVCVEVEVVVEVAVEVKVAVKVEVPVGVVVGVAVRVEVEVAVEVAVAAETVWILPLTVPPLTMAPCPVVPPTASTDVAVIWLLKVLFVIPGTLRSNTRIRLTGVPGVTLTKPLSFVKVTFPEASKVWLPKRTGSSPVSYKPSPFLSWYNLALPPTTSVAQLRLPAPVKANSRTNTFSWAEAVRTIWRLDTLTWLNP